jgi:hypothetical protein
MFVFDEREQKKISSERFFDIPLRETTAEDEKHKQQVE